VNIDPKTLMDIWKVGRDGTNPAPVLAGPFNEYSARLTPDGKWLAYTSDESGRPEIYVQPYPNATRKWQISTQGGSEPMWRENGRELFYVAASQTLNVVSVQTTPEFSASRPTKLSDTVIDTSSGGPQTTHYAVTADGERFLANVAAANPVPPTIVTNWMSAAGPASAK
jgi:Tol biopolymer transport system component